MLLTALENKGVMPNKLTYCFKSGSAYIGKEGLKEIEKLEKNTHRNNTYSYFTHYVPKPACSFIISNDMKITQPEFQHNCSG